MLLQDVSTFYDAFGSNEHAYVSMNERTRYNLTAKLHLWMRFVIIKHKIGEDMLNMLESHYKVNYYSIHRGQARCTPSATERAVKKTPMKISAFFKSPQSSPCDSQNRAPSNN